MAIELNFAVNCKGVVTEGVVRGCWMLSIAMAVMFFIALGLMPIPMIGKQAFQFVHAVTWTPALKGTMSFASKAWWGRSDCSWNIFFPLVCQFDYGDAAERIGNKTFDDRVRNQRICRACQRFRTYCEVNLVDVVSAGTADAGTEADDHGICGDASSQKPGLRYGVGLSQPPKQSGRMDQL